MNIHTYQHIPFRLAITCLKNTRVDTTLRGIELVHVIYVVIVCVIRVTVLSITDLSITIATMAGLDRYGLSPRQL